MVNFSTVTGRQTFWNSLVCPQSPVDVCNPKNTSTWLPLKRTDCRHTHTNTTSAIFICLRYLSELRDTILIPSKLVYQSGIPNLKLKSTIIVQSQISQELLLESCKYNRLQEDKILIPQRQNHLQAFAKFAPRYPNPLRPS